MNPAPNSIETIIYTIDRIDHLIPDCLDTISSFYVSASNAFSAKLTQKRPKLLSHALCVDTTLGMESYRKSCPFFNHEARLGQFRFLYGSYEARNLVKKREHISWQNAYTICVVAQTFIKFNAKYPKDTDDKGFDWLYKAYDILISVVLKKVIHDNALGETKWGHAFMLYNIQRAFDALLEDQDCIVKVAEKDVNIYKKLEKQSKKLQILIENKLHYYVSMCSAIRDVEDYAMQLGYLIYSLMKYKPQLKNDVLSEHAVKLCVNVLFGEGQFPRAQTVFREKDDNISASPLEILMLLSTLGTIRNRFDGFEKAYGLTLNWVLATQRFHKEKMVWYAEPWRGVDACEAWLNALVLNYLFAHRELLRCVCQDKVKIEFGATKDSSEFSWDDVLLDDQSKNDLKLLFLDILEDDKKHHRKLSKSSILLFGPPGTSKTSIGRTIAAHLNFDFILIAPHHVAEEGLEGLVRSTRKIFDRIRTLSDCVVLLDEIDELVTDRKLSHEKISRLITVSVLPWLQKLKEQAKIILIATTNNIRHFDPAVKRPGRFDFVIPVGPPSAKQRLNIIKKYFESKKIEIVNSKIELIANGIGQVKYVLNTLDYADNKWQPTIGEINYVCELLYRNSEHLQNDNEVITAAKKHSERFAKQPLITYKEYERFQKEKDTFRHPPSE